MTDTVTDPDTVTRTGQDPAGTRQAGPAPDPTVLSPDQRRRAMAELASREFDVLVIGGGVTGTGIALDAATRGLSTALVEMRDYAAGTSSRSGKLFHGGLRYLEQLNFSLVWEALHERGLMLKTICPHLVTPLKFIYPLEHRVWERAYAGSGVLLYDVMSGKSGVPHHRHLTRTGVRKIAPGLRQDTLAGALTYYDVQVDDARHTMMLARTAAGYGAVVASAAKVVGFLKDGPRVVGVKVLDTESPHGETIDVRAREVINAGGVWTDEVQKMLGGKGLFQVKASKGVHLMVAREKVHSDAAILCRAEDSVLIIRPWGEHWLIGTTDTAWEFDLSHPAATKADIDYLLRNVNRILDPPLTWDDVEGVYAGLRPLLSGESDATSKLSREHAVVSPAPGFTVIAGGKYTTYRVMAKDAVDAAVGDLGRPVPSSVTDKTPLLGADGYLAYWNSTARLAAESGLSVEQVEHLLRRQGSLVKDLLVLVAERPELGRPIPGAEDYLLAEAVYAASHEGALHLDDVLTRRLHASIETHDRGLEAAAAVAPLIGEVLGWDEATLASEVEHYQKRVAAEIASEKLPDDRSADEARRVIRDPRISSGEASAKADAVPVR